MAKAGERDQSRERYWRAVVAEHERSGLSIREFCSRRRLREPSYYHWRREIRLRDRERGQKDPRAATDGRAGDGARSRESKMSSAAKFVPIILTNDVDEGRGSAKLETSRAIAPEFQASRTAASEVDRRRCSMIEIELSGAVVRVPAGVDHETLSSVLALLRPTFVAQMSGGGLSVSDPARDGLSTSCDRPSGQGGRRC